MPLDEHSIDRIIEAVGDRYVPATLDKSSLRRAIQKSDIKAEIISAHRHGARTPNWRKRLKQFREMAKPLALWFEVKDDATDIIEEVWSKSIRQPDGWPLALLTGVIVDVCEACEDTLRNADVKLSQWGNPTANEWLAGVELPCVFEEHFLGKPGGSRNIAGKAGGPCVRFIASTMLELGKPYSPESILRAMTRLRRLRETRSIRQRRHLASPELDKT
jgi:hypothetical protein